MDNNDFERDGRASDRQARSTKSGVKRVNNTPLLIAGGVLVVFVILVAWVATDRAQRVKQKRDANHVVTVDQGLADSVLKASGGRTGGLVEDESSSLPIAHIGNLDLPPPPPSGAPQAPAEDSFATQLKATKLALFQKAIAARTEVDGTAAKLAKEQSSVANSAPADLANSSVSADQANTAALADQAGIGNATSGNTGAAVSGYAQFDRRNGEDRWQLGSSVEKPRTAYELRTGFVIPATLISGVNSDLPGQIIAQVSQDVYDTATGKYKLIPQGTRLVGAYDSKVVFGQSRVLVAWQRLVFPDGKAMDIGSMPGADSIGQAGFKDVVNNHYLRIFGTALLMSAIVGGINSSQTNPNNDPFGTSTNTILTQAVAQQMGQAAVEVFRKNLNISPTLEIRPGYRFNVMVVKDLTFNKPYQAFDY